MGGWGLGSLRVIQTRMRMYRLESWAVFPIPSSRVQSFQFKVLGLGFRVSGLGHGV